MAEEGKKTNGTDTSTSIPTLDEARNNVAKFEKAAHDATESDKIGYLQSYADSLKKLIVIAPAAEKADWQRKLLAALKELVTLLPEGEEKTSVKMEIKALQIVTENDQTEAKNERRVEIQDPEVQSEGTQIEARTARDKTEDNTSEVDPTVDLSKVSTKALVTELIMVRLKNWLNEE